MTQVTTQAEKTGEDALLRTHAGAPTEAELLRRLGVVVEEVIAPNAARVDREHAFPWAGLRSLGLAGLGGLTLPRELGGQATTMRAYAEVIAGVAAVCGSTSTVLMTQLHCAHPIHVRGTRAQQERWIPALCAAEAVGAIALTEPDAGSAVASMRTTARRFDDGWVVNGSKIFISNGDVADVIVLFASVDLSRGKDAITAFLVDTRDLVGFEAGQPMDKLGQKGASTVALTFEDCRLPADAVLGEVGRGYGLLLDSVKTSRISAAAQGIGMAEGALTDTARFCLDHGLLSTRNRSAQDLQFALARLRSQVQAGRELLLTACDLVDAEAPEAAAAVSMAKLHCTALGVTVSSECVELLGHDGDRGDLGVERRLREAKICEIYDGTNQVQSMLIARDLRLALER